MKPCISEATTMPCTFQEDVEAYAEAGVAAMEVWLTKLEQHLETNINSDTKKLLNDRGIILAAGAYQGGLMLSQGEQRKAHFDHFKRRLDLCQYFSIPTIVLAPDFVGDFDAADLERAIVSLKQAAQWAASADVTLALEPRGRERFCASVPTAVALVAQVDEPNVGICLDLFHYYVGPSKLEDLALLASSRLVHVQVSDVLGVPRETASDADRILPGDGEFQLGPIFDVLRRIGYAGHVSLELMNPTIWEMKPRSVAEIGLASLQRLLDDSRPEKPSPPAKAAVQPRELVPANFTARFQRRIYLLRHADVRYFDESGRPYPPNDVDLSDEGRRQAEALGRELRDVAFDRVITSDLPRTAQTAAIIMDQNAASPPPRQAFPELREIQPGRLSELASDQRRQAFLDAFAESLTYDSKFLGGETFRDFFDRVEPFFLRLIHDRSWQRVLLVAHGGVNRVLLIKALNLDLHELGSIEQDACCLNVIDVDERARMLVRLLNHTAHNPNKAGMQLTTMERLFLDYCGGET